jgi:hypothetical protein
VSRTTLEVDGEEKDTGGLSRRTEPED